MRAAVMLRRRVTAHSTPPQSLSTLTQFLSHTGETRKKKPRPCFFQLVFVIRQGGREGNEGEFYNWSEATRPTSRESLSA